uniref:Putative secreted peptide n=1 Tax=Anopheles braziliensis TaxID=58242 RepID=A0A2M3ZPW1_9DIPT
MMISILTQSGLSILFRFCVSFPGALSMADGFTIVRENMPGNIATQYSNTVGAKADHYICRHNQNQSK